MNSNLTETEEWAVWLRTQFVVDSDSAYGAAVRLVEKLQVSGKDYVARVCSICGRVVLRHQGGVSYWHADQSVFSDHNAHVPPSDVEVNSFNIDNVVYHYDMHQKGNNK